MGNPPSAAAKEARRFQATAIVVLSPHCIPPSEKTPISKAKQELRQEQQQQREEQQQQKQPQ